ncbi:MAG: putative DNA modification/repair radical SAM protein [Clostridia bacterium]|nr:putative DNA modification/repair radical SAM protein [Clostridia bacterium]
MDIMQKLSILADAAKYDVSCASSGVNRGGVRGSLGNSVQGGICHSFTSDGRCISLLKVLYTNYCTYDCAYCINRKSNDVPRASFTPEELCELTYNFYLRNFIEGLFLSSAVIKSPDYTTELMYRTVFLLRSKYKFNGYIHVKAIPGTDPALLERLGAIVDRMSVNIELPSEASLKLLAPDKKKDDIVAPMKLIKNKIIEYKDTARHLRGAPKFVPGGQSTQMIIGASGDTDLRILSLTEAMYRKYDLKRVYFSAYVPVNTHPLLPSVLTAPPMLREHRLYQADFLLRFYEFRADEILNEANPNFSRHIDPKCQWALLHLDQFPIEVNRAPYNKLLRIPGIGQISAKRIIQARRHGSLSLDDLAKLGAVVKRARFFVTCSGRYDPALKFDEQSIFTGLLQASDVPDAQLSFFNASSPVLALREAAI